MSSRLRPVEILLFLTLIGIGFAMYYWGYWPTLDMRFYYSTDEAKKFFDALSGEDTEAYLRNELFDLGFVLIYSLLFVSFSKAAFPKSRLAFFAALIPGLFDFVETSTIIEALQGQGAIGMPLWLGIVTTLKWAVGLLIAVVFMWARFSGTSSKKRVAHAILNENAPVAQLDRAPDF